MKPLLVVTDLDGSLLNEDYSFAEAAPALAELRERGIPLVINSSKSAPECAWWQQQLGTTGPFICENGAAIVRRSGAEILPVQQFGMPRSEVLAALRILRGEGFEFAGFDDWSLDELVAATGLPRQQARLAAQRQYSEPLLFGEDSTRQAAFTERLAEFGLGARQGGGFLTVGGDCDKGNAMLALASSYGAVTLVAVGDSPNDLAMLCSADIALLIRSKYSPEMELAGPATVLRSEATGSRGWAQVIMKLLQEV